MTARAMRLSELLRGAGVVPLDPTGSDPTLTGVGLDSRTIEPGNLFFAVPGFRFRGETFVPQAVLRGARAVAAPSPRPAGLSPKVAWVRVEEPRIAAALLSREFHGRPDAALALAGITGTNGKTTVAYLLEAIARAAGRRTGLVGTVAYRVGDREQRAVRTTPEAPELYRLLASMRDEGVEIVPLEVSSHALALRRVEGARFTVAAFLNLGRDHLDFHGDQESYFEAKARLFDALDASATAVLPEGDRWAERLAERTRALVITFGRGRKATVRLREEHVGLEGSSAVLETPAGPLPVRTHLGGRHNLENVAAAAACALALQLPPEAISSGVPSLRGVPGRLEPVDRGQPFAAVVDFAHTEAALERLLTSLREMVPGRVLVVFGCGGERDRGKRPGMGRTAARLADRVFLTSDNPRGEDPGEILSRIEEGVREVPEGPERCRVLPDRREAVREAVREARSGDVVVVAGKGHETTQVIGDRAEPMDDRELLAEALASLGWTGGARAHA